MAAGAGPDEDKSTTSRKRPQLRQRTVLPPDQSVALSEQLVAELAQLASLDDAAAWAKKSLPEKNRLAEKDAQKVELGFALVLSKFDDNATDNAQPHSPAEVARSADATRVDQPTPQRRPVAAKLIRLRDPEHRKYVARQPCLICGRRPCDAHHLRFAQPQAMGSKVSDEFTVPLCRTHHRHLHQVGDEKWWWAKYNIDVLSKAAEFWGQTRRSIAGLGKPSEIPSEVIGVEPHVAHEF